jgi:sulfur-carrier protein
MANHPMIRVVIPFHLRTLANITGEIKVEVTPPITVHSILDAVESRYPMLRGTIRDHVTQKRRDFLRFYACQNDLSNDPTDIPLPDQVASGAEPFLVIGAIAGG